MDSAGSAEFSLFDSNGNSEFSDDDLTITGIQKQPKVTFSPNFYFLHAAKS